MEKKGQIFFFGRPGCLKQSIPIRVSAEEEAEKKNEDSIEKKDKVELEKPISTSDDDTDGDELMKRISEALGDEPGNSKNNNDKSNDSNSMEKCERVSPVNNDHDKLVKEENNDNMLSALETLSENNENVEEISERSSVNSAKDINNTTENCTNETTNANNDESPLESDLNKITENTLTLDENEVNRCDESNLEVASDTKDASVPSSDEVIACNITDDVKTDTPSTLVGECNQVLPPLDLENKAVELPRELSLNSIEDENNSKAPIIENQETSSITVSESEVIESENLNEQPIEIASTSSEIETTQKPEVIAASPIPEEITEQQETLVEVSTPSESVIESQLEISSDKPLELNEPQEHLEVTKNEESSSKIEILPSTEATCIPESCDKESNRMDEEIKQHPEPEDHSTSEISAEEIKINSEPIETKNIISENTLVSDSNKNELDGEGTSNESIKNEMLESQEIVKEDSLQHVKEESVIENENIPETSSVIDDEEIRSLEKSEVNVTPEASPDNTTINEPPLEGKSIDISPPESPSDLPAQESINPSLETEEPKSETLSTITPEPEIELKQNLIDNQSEVSDEKLNETNIVNETSEPCTSEKPLVDEISHEEESEKVLEQSIENPESTSINEEIAIISSTDQETTASEDVILKSEESISEPEKATAIEISPPESPLEQPLKKNSDSTSDAEESSNKTPSNITHEDESPKVKEQPSLEVKTAINEEISVTKSTDQEAPNNEEIIHQTSEELISEPEKPIEHEVLPLKVSSDLPLQESIDSSSEIEEAEHETSSNITQEPEIELKQTLIDIQSEVQHEKLNESNVVDSVSEISVSEPCTSEKTHVEEISQEEVSEKVIEQSIVSPESASNNQEDTIINSIDQEAPINDEIPQKSEESISEPEKAKEIDISPPESPLDFSIRESIDSSSETEEPKNETPSNIVQESEIKLKQNLIADQSENQDKEQSTVDTESTSINEEKTLITSTDEKTQICSEAAQTSKEVISEPEKAIGIEVLPLKSSSGLPLQDSIGSSSEKAIEIEEHKGVEICGLKSEDVSIAEEAMPREDVLVTEINQKSDQVPTLNKVDTIVESQVSNESQKLIENAPEDLPQVEVIEHTKNDEPRTEKALDTPSPTEDVKTDQKSPENSKQELTEETHERVSITKSQVVTRKRKISERKSISESDSDGANHFVSESVSQDHSDAEEEVQRKKPRIRGKVMTPRRKLPTRHSARVEEASKVVESPQVEEIPEASEKIENETTESKTLQNFKFDYDENEDVVANIAAIKTLICKEPSKTEEDVSSDDDSPKKKTGRPGRKGKRGRPVPKKVETQYSSSDDEDTKSSKTPDSKRTKTESDKPTPEPVKKKRETKKGLLRDLDTSLVIETIDNEAPVRASRRIAQQKIKEETDRRLMEERMLKQMKDEAERKKTGSSQTPAEDKSSDSDESYKGATQKKKKKKIKASDKHWQTSSSHSEHTETDPDEFEHPRSEDPGSPLFRSDHEFSPESEDDDATPVQPVKRARTAKKQVEESSDEEHVNPNHACQVCHKTDSPEWILLCDECDCGYHCSCLKPIIFCIPSGNWYCPLCCHKKLISDLGVQLEKLDVLVESIEAEELRKQKQIEAKKLTEITEQNILNDRRNKRAGGRRSRDKEGSQDEQSSGDNESESNDNGNESSSSDNSSDNAPLIYKLRKRNQTAASYRFNDYDELINSAIRDEMEEVKGLGNAGRGKDISTIIEADKEEKKMQRLEKERVASGIGEKKMPSDDEKEEGESSGSEIGRSKKSMQKKKKNRKLNNLEDTSEEEGSDDDFKGSSSSNSDTDEEFSASSVSESSLDLPKKKSKNAPRSMRTRNRRMDQKFIDDASSDDEPLIKKRNKKQSDSEEEFDLEGSGSGSTAEEVDSEDLCDDTDTESSESNWPRKKKRVASYDKKPRKPAKKFDEDDNKAFRAGISKKKILEQKKEEEESDGSGSQKEKGRRKTRGKKLLYIMEDDFESDDGIKPGAGVVRPETPPEEREMFIKKQEEIKKMLAAKNTEGARKLAVPTIEPLSFDIEQPKSPSLPPLDEPSSLSTIPKDVIQGAKALDFDFNRIKPVHSSTASKVELQPEMSEEELAKMMEEEDFAQHQLKLAGEAIRKQQAILELEGKEEAFAAFSKAKLKDEKLPMEVPIEPKKRAKKPKIEKALNEPVKVPIADIPKSLPDTQPRPIHPHAIPSTQPLHASSPHHPINATSAPPPLISNISHQPPLHAPYSNLPSRFQLNPNQPLPPHNLQERPSVLSSFMAGHPRPEMHPRPDIHAQQAMGFHRQIPPEGFIPKGPPHLPSHIQQAATLPPSQAIPEEKEKKGRRKKFTPLRQDLPEANLSKVAKLDPPITAAAPTSVIHTNVPSVESKGIPPALQRSAKATVAVASPPQIFNPGTSPTPSVITRLIQQQQQQSPAQQRIGPYAGFTEHIGSAGSDNAPSSQPPPSATSRAYPSTDEIKHLAAASKQSRPSPQAPFTENPFVPRTMHHTLYRAPPTSQSIYGIPPHARLPYPFHLPPHPNNNLRPNMQDYASSPYGIPPQFAYYAPPAHSRPSNASTTTAHPISQHPETIHHPPGPPRGDAENPQQQPSEFGGLVSYFSSQQELD